METGDKSHLKTLGASHRARNNTVVMSSKEVNSVRHEGMSPALTTNDDNGWEAPNKEERVPPENVSTTSDVFEEIFGEEKDESVVPEVALSFDDDVFGDFEEQLGEGSQQIEASGEGGGVKEPHEEGRESQSFAVDEALGSIDILDSSGESFDSEVIGAAPESLKPISGPHIEEAMSGEVSKEAEEEFSSSRPVSSPCNDSFEQVVWKKNGPIAGFLVSFDNNENGSFVELREGRLLVTSELAATQNCLVINHPSVSPMHAILRVSRDPSIDVLDQLSEQGTRIVSKESGNEVALSGDRGVLRHGDVVIFGERTFHVCLLAVDKN